MRFICCRDKCDMDSPEGDEGDWILGQGMWATGGHKRWLWVTKRVSYHKKPVTQIGFIVISAFQM